MEQQHKVQEGQQLQVQRREMEEAKRAEDYKRRRMEEDEQEKVRQEQFAQEIHRTKNQQYQRQLDIDEDWRRDTERETDEDRAEEHRRFGGREDRRQTDGDDGVYGNGNWDQSPPSMTESEAHLRHFERPDLIASLKLREGQGIVSVLPS